MNKHIPILLGMILLIGAIWLYVFPDKNMAALIDRLEHLGYDLQLRTHILTKNLTPSPSIAIVDIDDNSLKKIGRWPWDRSTLATLVEKLEAQGAAVIAFDVFFSEKENNIDDLVIEKLKKENDVDASLVSILKKYSNLFDHDDKFAAAIAKSQVILAIGFLPRAETNNVLPTPILKLTPAEQLHLNIVKPQGFISNIPVLQQAATGSGFINIFPDNDGIIRSAPLLLSYQGNIYPSLALQSVMSFLGESISLITPKYNQSYELEGVQLGSIVIPTDRSGNVFIPFIGKSYTFPYYSAADVLEDKLPKDTLLGKIIFVGTSATGLGDLVPTAIQNPFPGVEIQATIVNGILANDFSYQPAWTYGANLFVLILFGLLSAWIFPYLGPRALGLIIIFVPLAMLFLNNWIWESTGLILSFIIPVVLVLILALFNILYGYLFETRRREHLKTMFGQYVPEKHIDEMLKSSSDFGLHGEDREMTVLFADIRNFTTISEGMSAADLVDMLNTFFTPMTEIIFKHRGTIDKYIGDLIMAFWGAPLKDKYHAQHALQSALEMRDKIKEMQPLIAERNWPDIQMGIGLNTGIMSVGDMGSRFRRNYTVLGDAVNLASRVEGLTKFYGVDIIATEATEQHHAKFVFRKLDKVRVKGKKTGVAIYELICTKAHLTPALEQELEKYHTALNHYFAQEWDAAENIMQPLHDTFPDTKIYKLYLDRIKEMKSQPPADNWDGVFVHTSK